ncbi:MAG: metallophosphoesterase, partial [Sphaerochaeta sp.]
MDTLLFSSDLHGSLPALKLLIVKATKIQAKALLIAGDLCPPDNPAFFLTYSNSEIPIILVRGNCDSAYDFDLAHIPLPPVTR